MTVEEEGGFGVTTLEDEALQWMLRIKAGDATDSDLAALQAWRDASPAHEEAYLQALRLWRNVMVASRELAEDERARATVGRLQSRPLNRRLVLGGAMAATAAAACYLVVRPPLGLWPSLAELTADYRTGKGEQRAVQLAGHVAVEMNTDTSFAVRALPNLIEVRFVSGEAAFSKDADEGQALRVVAGSGEVVASDAKFEIRCLDGKVDVTCLAGSVQVQCGAGTTTLQAGQQIAYTAQGLAMPHPADREKATAWQSGLLIFRDSPLSNVVAEINRYRPGRIILVNPSLGARVVNATFHIDHLDDFVAQVQQLFGADVRRLPAGILLIS